MANGMLDVMPFFGKNGMTALSSGFIDGFVFVFGVSKMDQSRLLVD
jgi:hypothetical protein